MWSGPRLINKWNRIYDWRGDWLTVQLCFISQIIPSLWWGLRFIKPQNCLHIHWHICQFLRAKAGVVPRVVDNIEGNGLALLTMWQVQQGTNCSDVWDHGHQPWPISSIPPQCIICQILTAHNTGHHMVLHRLSCPVFVLRVQPWRKICMNCGTCVHARDF